MSTAWVNGDMLPMTGEGDSFEALLAADDGTILATGSTDQVRSLDPTARVVDLGGACVMPGLIDAHSHLTWSTQYLASADLMGCASHAELVERLRAFAAQHPEMCQRVIVGAGYDRNDLAEGVDPTAAVLDQVSRDLPVVAMAGSQHMLACNTVALVAAGITADTPDPEGGRYARLPSGEPDGYVEEMPAMAPVNALVARLQDLHLAELIGDMQDLYLAQGITTCQDGATDAATASELRALAAAGALKLDVVAYPRYGEDVRAIADGDPTGVGAPYQGHLRFGGFKMFLDGSPQGRTAWLSRSYEPGPEGAGYAGYGTLSDEDAYRFCRLAIDSNRQLLTHCNGDEASEQLLRVYGRALADSPNPLKRGLRPVMVHCQTVRRDQLERMGPLNMVPSFFVSHCWYWGDVHLKNLGADRAGRISPVHDALALRLPFTFHCDTPVLRPNLFEAVWCAVMRRTKGGAQLDEDQRVSVYQALRAITVNAAYQYGEEGRKGTLEVGKLADLAVLSANPLTIPLDRLRDIQVRATVKEGNLVWGDYS